MTYIKHSGTESLLTGKRDGHNNFCLQSLLFSRETQRATKHSLFNFNIFIFFPIYLFLFLTLYMFRAHRAHHQERQIV